MRAHNISDLHTIHPLGTNGFCSVDFVILYSLFRNVCGFHMIATSRVVDGALG